MPMAASVWKGSIVLSLISVPIKLYAAARSERLNLHQIHRKCHTRLRQPLFCPTCNRIVERDEVIKGYETDDGQYVLLEQNEIKKLTANSSSNLEIVTFTKLTEIDPIFFDASYYCVPEESGKKGYHLIVKTLTDTKTVGIGKLLMHQRDYTVFLRPYQHGLLLHTMYFANEIRQLQQFESLTAGELKPQEVKLAEQLVGGMTEHFHPKQYHDEFQDRLRKLIEAKQEGKTIEVEEKGTRAPVIDMMTALKKSLASSAQTAKKKHAGRARKAPIPIRKVS